MSVRPLNRRHNALVTRLGAVIYRWAYVEYFQGELFAFVLGADPGRAHIISKNISSNTITGWLRVLAPFQFTHPDTQTALASLFDRIDHARAERNNYAHGLWSAGNEPGTADVMTIKWERAEIMKRELVTLHDLDSLLTDIAEIEAELRMLGIKIGYYPAAGSPQRKRTQKLRR